MEKKTLLSTHSIGKTAQEGFVAVSASSLEETRGKTLQSTPIAAEPQNIKA